MKLPVADIDEAVKAVEQYKGSAGDGVAATLKAADTIMRARKLLAQIRDERAQGLRHANEKGEVFETPERAMAYALAGKKIVVLKPEGGAT